MGFGGMNHRFDGVRLIEEVALNVFVFVFHAEELEDALSPAVGAERSGQCLMAAPIQPGYSRFARRPPEGHDRQERFAFLAGQVRRV